MNRTFTSAQSKFIPQGEPIVKNIIVITGAASGFGALAARALGAGRPHRLRNCSARLIDRTPTAHMHDRSAYPMSVAVEEVDDI